MACLVSNTLTPLLPFPDDEAAGLYSIVIRGVAGLFNLVDFPPLGADARTITCRSLPRHLLFGLRQEGRQDEPHTRPSLPRRPPP